MRVCLACGVQEILDLLEDVFIQRQCLVVDTRSCVCLRSFAEFPTCFYVKIVRGDRRLTTRETMPGCGVLEVGHVHLDHGVLAVGYAPGLLFWRSQLRLERSFVASCRWQQHSSGLQECSQQQNERSFTMLSMPLVTARLFLDVFMGCESPWVVLGALHTGAGPWGHVHRDTAPVSRCMRAAAWINTSSFKSASEPTTTTTTHRLRHVARCSFV